MLLVTVSLQYSRRDENYKTRFSPDPHLLLVLAPRQMLSRLEQSVYCCRPTWGRWRGGSEVEDKEIYTALAFIKQLLTCTYRVPLNSRTTFYRNSWLGWKTIQSVGFKVSDSKVVKHLGYPHRLFSLSKLLFWERFIAITLVRFDTICNRISWKIVYYNKNCNFQISSDC